MKSLQKEQNSTNLLLWPPICQNKPAITPKWFNSLDTNSNWRIWQLTRKIQAFLHRNMPTFWTMLTFWCRNLRGNQLNLKGSMVIWLILFFLITFSLHILNFQFTEKQIWGQKMSQTSDDFDILIVVSNAKFEKKLNSQTRFCQDGPNFV